MMTMTMVMMMITMMMKGTGTPKDFNTSLNVKDILGHGSRLEIEDF